ncbi:hypothetical protein FB561_2632 [Kribbella amoyensis]|uniref:Peptidase inhibitor family I36 n=1 Tax=Kribbella amoyensis TaxID=996641 RepID=A0A561BRN0_9ACTN|nr:hypothetical protein [Kribbella amoyensis]TWD81516.1 hypothetical protein FB561_2632 [Kribbella amoyensis]
MRAITKLTLGIVATGALGVAGAAVATADRGDGLLACNSGEICFAEHANGSGGQRHFYYGSANHAAEGNFHNGVPFYHNASAIMNRDTVSAVCVTESGDWVNDSWQFPARSTTWSAFAYDLNDENGRHTRSAC